MIEVIPCGTDVTLKDIGIKGTITGITIRFVMVEYEVTYFFDGKLHNPWMNECLFTPGPHEKQQIGFNSSNK